MAQLINITRVVISDQYLSATIVLDAKAPVRTNQKPAGTRRLLKLVPELRDHACFGDRGERFGDVAERTEVAHLLEHLVIELLARTGLADDIVTGQTRKIADRCYELRLGCPDDVLVAGALSSAAWILEWAYNPEDESMPDVDAIAQGLVQLLESVKKNEEAELEAVAEDHADDGFESVSDDRADDEFEAADDDHADDEFEAAEELTDDGRADLEDAECGSVEAKSAEDEQNEDETTETELILKEDAEAESEVEHEAEVVQEPEAEVVQEPEVEAVRETEAEAEPEAEIEPVLSDEIKTKDFDLKEKMDSDVDDKLEAGTTKKNALNNEWALKDVPRSHRVR